MTDEECTVAFTQLAQLLDSIGLGWARAQVEDHISLGLLHPVRVSERVVYQLDLDSAEHRVARGDASSFDEPISYRGRGPEFTRATAYTPQERLSLLLDAIEQVIVKTAEMERDAAVSFADVLGADGIKFETRDVITTPEESRQPARIELLERLATLLMTLRKAI
jgi:hypothetical protein